MKRVLVTTALEKTWPLSDEPILFLGEWCLLYSKKEKLEHLDFKTADYHWNNRKKIYSDYQFLHKLYEELLCDLAKKLNLIHNTNYSIRYWRVIIGPWLGFFTQAIFDRWFMIQKTVKNNNISYVNVTKNKNEDFISNDMAHFSEMFIDDAWNEYIYGKILEFYNFKNIKYIAHSRIDDHYNSHLKLFDIKKFKNKFTLFANFIFGITSKNDDYFLISTYLSLIQNIVLQIKLGQIPKLWRFNKLPTFRSEMNKRKWSLAKVGDQHGDFSSLIRSLIPLHIPVSYLEAYKNVVNLCNKSMWPRNPKCIFTGNSFCEDDFFKIWAAEKIENKTPLITYQHGGNYGIALWSYMQDHQLAISDYFLSWGWTNLSEKKIKPFGNFKISGGPVIPRKKGNLLLVEMAIPRFSYHMYSLPVSACQFSHYLNEQFSFVNFLPKKIQKKLIVRHHSEDYNLAITKRWKDMFPEITLSNNNSFFNAMKNSRLIIATYNATTFLESLSLNFPTIIFWNKNYWEMNKEATIQFKILTDVGIFHFTPKSAADQVEKVWDNIEEWWCSNEVQIARNNFCNSYARNINNPSADLVGFIEGVC